MPSESNIENLEQELINCGLNLQHKSECLCKVCSEVSTLFEVIDFNRTCSPDNYPFGLSGIPIYFFRCSNCGFIFNNAFDEFNSKGWVDHVYNADYFKYLDIDYKVVRPNLNAELLSGISTVIGNKKILGVDYGGGNGSLSDMMNRKGIKFYSHDPFDYSNIEDNMKGLFNFVSAFEVLEHTTDPIGTFEQMLELVGDKFVFVISTQCSHGLIDLNQHLCWHYVAPRNGHVSVYTNMAFKEIAIKFSLDYLPVSRGLHLFGRGFNLQILKYAAGLVKLKQRVEAKIVK